MPERSVDARLHERHEIPEVGSKWRSRDPRDEGLIATVLDYANGYVRIQRFRKTQVSLRRFHKEYARVG